MQSFEHTKVRIIIRFTHVVKLEIYSINKYLSLILAAAAIKKIDSIVVRAITGTAKLDESLYKPERA